MERYTKVRPKLTGLESQSNDNIAEATIQRKMLRSFIPDYELCSMATLCNETTQTDLIGDEVYQTGDKYTIWSSQMDLPEKKASFTSIINSDEEEFFSDIGADETYIMPDFIGIKLSLRPRILLKDTKKTVTVLVNAESLVRDEIKLKVTDWPTGDFYLSVGDFQIFPNRSSCLPHYIMITTDYRKFSLDEPMFYGVDPQHAEREKAAWRKKEKVGGGRATGKGKKTSKRPAKTPSIPSFSFSFDNTDTFSYTESLDTIYDKKKTFRETHTKQVDTSDLILEWQCDDSYNTKQTQQNVISSATQTLVHIRPSSVSDSEYTELLIKHYSEDIIKERSDYPESTGTVDERQDALLTDSNNLNSDNTMMDVSDFHDTTGSVLPSEEQSPAGETEEDVSEITERVSKMKGPTANQTNYNNKHLFSHNFDVANSTRPDQGTHEKDSFHSNAYGGNNLEDINDNPDDPSQLPNHILKTQVNSTTDSANKTLEATDYSTEILIGHQKTNVFLSSENLEAQENSSQLPNHILKTHAYPNADIFNKSLEASDNSSELPIDNQKTQVNPGLENKEVQDDPSQFPNHLIKTQAYPNDMGNVTSPTTSTEKPTDTSGSTFGRRPSLLKAMVAVEEEISPLISDLTRISNEFKSIELTPDVMPPNLPPLHTPNIPVLPSPNPEESLSLSSGRPSNNVRNSSSRTLNEFYKSLGLCPTVIEAWSEVSDSQDYGQEVGTDGTTCRRPKKRVPATIQNPYLSLQEVQEELARPYDRRSKDYKPASVWSDPDQFLGKPPPD